MNEPISRIATVDAPVQNTSIYFLTVHKGASSFVSATLGPRLSAELDLVHVRVGTALMNASDDLAAASQSFGYQQTGHLYTQLYPDSARHVDFRKGRSVALVRDPRDAAVSWYFSIAYSHPPLPGIHGARLLEQREHLRRMSMCHGIKKVAPSAIQEFKTIRRIVTECDRILVTRYEDMVTNFAQWFDRVVDHLELTVHRDPFYLLQSEFVVEREDVSKHKRRITPGNWQEVFDDELRDYFEGEVGPWMRERDYHW